MSSYQAVEHSVSVLKHILHAFVIDAHRGRKKLRSKLPEAEAALGKLWVKDPNRDFESISLSNFLSETSATPFLANSKTVWMRFYSSGEMETG